MMATYRVETSGGTYEIETTDAPAAKQAQPDVFEKAVNYHTGNTLIDAPLGVLQGAAKGAASTGVGIGALARKVAGLPPLPADTYQLDTEAQGIGQGTGKFLEQAAEFAVPGSAVGKGLKGAGLATRALAQGATAGAVGAAQSGGDPLATGVSAGLGGAGELVPAAISGAKGLLSNKSPTLANFSKSFANATPTQKAVISEVLPQLQKDGIKPVDPHAMVGQIKGKLGDLGQQYEALKQSGSGQAPADADSVLQGLRNLQKKFINGTTTITKEVDTGLADADGNPIMKTVQVKKPFVSNSNKPAYNNLQAEIKDIQKKAASQGGQLTFDDLRYMRDGVNGKTNFTSPDWEHELYGKIGNVYRGAMDNAVPGSADLNRQFAQYSKLDKVLETNISRGKADTQSGLDALLHRAAGHGVGASVGAGIGAAVGGPVGAAVGGAAGGILGPRVAKTAQQMLQNAIDQGSFQNLTKAGQHIAAYAASKNDTKTLLRILASGANKETVRRTATSTP